MSGAARVRRARTPGKVAVLRHRHFQLQRARIVEDCQAWITTIPYEVVTRIRLRMPSDSLTQSGKGLGVHARAGESAKTATRSSARSLLPLMFNRPCR